MENKEQDDELSRSKVGSACIPHYYRTRDTLVTDLPGLDRPIQDSGTVQKLQCKYSSVGQYVEHALQKNIITVLNISKLKN